MACFDNFWASADNVSRGGKLVFQWSRHATFQSKVELVDVCDNLAEEHQAVALD